MNQLPQNDYRVIVGLCSLTAAALMPFLVFHVVRAAWIMAIITGGLLAFTIPAGFWLYRHRQNLQLIRRAGMIIVLVANVTVSLAVAVEQQNTIYWIYPLIFINFYLLPTWMGTAINVAVCGLSLWLVSGVAPSLQLARLAGSIPLCIFFGLVFSQSIQRQRRELHYQANHDALTGVGNRLGLNEALEDATQRLNRYGEACTLVLLDLDHFKSVNDSLGHLNGDKIIAEFAHLLESRLRRTDLLFRFGGEEFVILLPHTPLAKGIQLAESLRTAVECHPFAQDRHLTTSAGISELQRQESPDSWLDRADRALYQAKEQGRNRVISADLPAESRNGETDRGDPRGARRPPRGEWSP